MSDVVIDFSALPGRPDDELTPLFRDLARVFLDAFEGAGVDDQEQPT